MEKERVFTLETRLNKEQFKYFEEYIIFYNKVYREVWQDCIHGEILDSKYKIDMSIKYNLLRRTINSIVQDVKGKYKTLKALQKQQCKQLEFKINAIDKDIKELKGEIAILHPFVEKNELDEPKLIQYRNKKGRLFALQKKKLKYKNKIDILKVKNRLSFGSKKFWMKQYNLGSNGFKTYISWYNQYLKKRDKYIYYIGSSDEKCGNSMFQLTYDKILDSFHCKVRKEKRYTCKGDKYIYFDINFKALRRDVLIKMLETNKSITYRVLRRDKKWYLQAIFSASFNIITNKSNGCLGVDFNNGFLAVTETDTNGNIKSSKIIELKYHGLGNKAKTEMEKVVKNLVKYCKLRKKALVIEDLNFNKKKSGVLSSKRNKRGKHYNQMIHSLDYTRFSELSNNSSIINGVEFIKVNSAYTSQIAKQKYCEQRKLNSHIGAAYIIARRGQGYIDKLVA